MYIQNTDKISVEIKTTSKFLLVLNYEAKIFFLVYDRGAWSTFVIRLCAVHTVKNPVYQYVKNVRS